MEPDGERAGSRHATVLYGEHEIHLHAEFLLGLGERHAGFVGQGYFGQRFAGALGGGVSTAPVAEQDRCFRHRVDISEFSWQSTAKRAVSGAGSVDFRPCRFDLVLGQEGADGGESRAVEAAVDSPVVLRLQAVLRASFDDAERHLNERDIVTGVAAAQADGSRQVEHGRFSFRGWCEKGPPLARAGR